MSGVTLRLNTARWREYLRTVAEAVPGIVPVIKGNGYGFGLRRLAEESALLGVHVAAVGMAREVASVTEAFPGDVVILNPWEPDSDIAAGLAADPRVISTVSRLADLEKLAGDQPAGHRPRVLVEVLTSMRRHGLRIDQLEQAAPLLDQLGFEGWTIHLPLNVEGRYAEAERLARAALQVAPGTLWFSHLPAEEASALARQLGGAGADPVPVRLRVGTRLWLGDESSRRTTATVLDVHPIRRGERAGYRQRICPADGWVLVVAGGTSHGIGMEAPTSATTLRQRAIAIATGSLEAAGLALSPYTINGKKRWFLEPPHMQSSLVFLPAKERPPTIGDEIPVELRLTTATVDTIADE
jgi:alanine racemase